MPSHDPGAVYIPITPGYKTPLVKGWSGDNPPTDEWWADAPEDANTAIRLDGFVMVDTDNEDLANWFRGQIAEHSWPVPTEVSSPRGIHFYWRTDERVPSFELDAPHAGDVRVKSGAVGSSRVDLQACKLEYSIVSPK